MSFATLLNVPFTGVGKMSPATLQRIFSGSPEGVPKPELIPILKIAIPKNYTAVTGHWSMYNKQIGVTEQVAYPIILKGMESYFLRVKNGDSTLLAKPFLFVSPASAAEKIEMIQYSGQAMELMVTTNAVSQLIIQQNAYPHWITTQPTQTIKQANEFISVPLKKGTQKVNITFEPTLVKFGLVFSAFCFLVFLGLFLFLSIRSASPL